MSKPPKPKPVDLRELDSETLWRMLEQATTAIERVRIQAELHWRESIA